MIDDLSASGTPYPAMSHPPAHPSVMAAAALLAGLRCDLSAPFHLLEIGCASGHHLLPIAASYPHARFTAIDIDATAIAEAKRLAHLADLSHIEWIHADFTQWAAPAQQFDLIIAHGIFSWVDDHAKSALLALIAQSLRPQGIAMISYNTQPGWALRQPLREMTLSLRHHPLAQGSAEVALAQMKQALSTRQDAYARYLHEVIDDTLAKGERQLAHDDLAAVCDPCYFTQFVHWTTGAQLRYLGETDSTLSPWPQLDHNALTQLALVKDQPLLHEQFIDFLTGRTFRTSLLGHASASLAPATQEEMAALIVEPIALPETTGDAHTDAFLLALHDTPPSTASIREITTRARSLSLAQAVTVATRLLALGLIRLHVTAPRISQEMPSHPQLSLLNRDHLAHEKPLVDAYHRPCHFRPNDRRWLARCDGQHSFEDLMKLARDDAEVRSLHALLQHLLDRGLLLP
jgi:trans-aconitate methyltransferase